MLDSSCRRPPMVVAESGAYLPHLVGEGVGCGTARLAGDGDGIAARCGGDCTGVVAAQIRLHVFVECDREPFGHVGHGVAIARNIGNVVDRRGVGQRGAARSRDRDDETGARCHGVCRRRAKRGVGGAGACGFRHCCWRSATAGPADGVGGCQLRRQGSADRGGRCAEILLAHGDVRRGHPVPERSSEDRMLMLPDPAICWVLVSRFRPLNCARAHNRRDLVAQGVDVGLNLVTVDVFFLCGNDLAFDVGQQLGNGFCRLAGHSDRGLTEVEAVRDALEAFDVGFHHLGDGPDRGIVLGAGDALAGGDFLLCLRQVRIDRFQRLQRHHGAIVRQDARHVLSLLFNRRFAPVAIAANGISDVFLTRTARTFFGLRHLVYGAPPTSRLNPNGALNPLDAIQRI